MSVQRRERGRGRRAADYLPLAVVVLLSAAAGGAREAGGAYFVPHEAMRDAMGFFLVALSMFKFFDLEGFADGFSKYDLLAKRFRPYATVYPFVEAGLGLGYLCRVAPGVVCGVTLAVMLFGACGVAGALRKGLDLDCACMGSILRVPLSTVALVEDVGMAAMAAAMLAMN
jgi:hypothetical protein